MYLAPYIACVGMFAVALLVAVRSKASTDPNSKGGIIVRAVLTFLLFAFVGVLWHYTSVDYLNNESIETWVRIISSVGFVCLLPEIWLEGKKGE